MTIKELIQEKEALSSEERAIMSRFGADFIVKRQPEQLEGADFINAVKGWLDERHEDDAGYQQAKKDGTLKIQRAVDLPEMGYRTYIYDLYSNGSVSGGVGGETINDAWLDAQRQKGGNYSYGTVDGQDYYVTW